METIYHDSEIHRVLGSQVAADTGTVETDAVATGDCDGVAFIVSFGDMVSGANVSMQITGRTTAGTGSWLNLPGAVVAFESDATDDVVGLVEIKRPNPWAEVRLEITRADQNAEIDGVTAVVYKGQGRPVSQPAEVVARSFTLGGYPT